MLNMSGHRAVALCPYGPRVALVHQDQKMKKANSGNIVIIDLNPWTARHGREAPSSRDHGRLTPLKDISCFQYDKLRATVPYVAYQGPQVSFPEDHEPTLVTTNRDGCTVVVSELHKVRVRSLKNVVHRMNIPRHIERGSGWVTTRTLSDDGGLCVRCIAATTVQ